MKRRSSGTRRALWRSLAAAALLVALTALVVWRLLSARPAWWNPAEPSAAESLSRGEYLENQIVTAFHKVRPADATRWTLELDAQWINAWLATRLPLWAANRNLSWSATLHEANVSISEGRLHFGARYGAGESGQVYSVDFQPELDGQGRLRLKALRIRAGRLPLPLGLALDSLEGLSRNWPELNAALRGDGIDPVFRLSDGRRVALRGLAFEDYRLLLTLETLPDR